MKSSYVLLVSVLIVSAALAGEVQLTNLPAADFSPGQLKLPLVVTERSGVERKAVVVASGVPFPPGFLADVSKLAVIDQTGKPVVSQATLMVKWHKPAYDDSVQWALVSFVADCPANGTATYYLVDSGVKSPASPLKVVRDDKQIAIETGPAKFTVPLAGDALISSASTGEKPVIGGTGLRGVITAGDWPGRELKAGDQHVTRHDDAAVEESGPARIVVRIKGTHAPGDKQARLYGFTTRLYFEAGSPAVRIVHTIDNSRLDAKLEDGLRRTYTWPVEDASLVADLALGGEATVSTLAEDKLLSAKSLTVYQDSSGQEKWQNLRGGNYEGWISKYTGGKTVRGVTFRGYKIIGDEKQIAAGDASQGVICAADNAAGVTAALRNFRVEYPSAMSASAKQLRVGLFPGEFSEPFHLNPGQRKSWDVRLTLHAGGAGEAALKDAFAVQDTLLLFRPEPAWMVRAGAAGAWPYGIANAPRKAGRPAQPRMDKSKLDGINVGWDWYGWISGYNSGGGHWNEVSVLLPWVLWGDGANFDQAEAKTLWSADLTALHWNNPDLSALWMKLMSWNDREARVSHETYPGWYSRDTWALPDSGHMGMLMWPEYYFITGDMRAREAIEHLGQRARAMLWQYNYDDRNDGTGPMARAVQWCKKRDPDADPEFRLYNRYIGWPLFDLANWYRLTGDAQLLAECRTVALAFRNTARLSPIGFMCLQINPKGSKAVYGGQGPFEKYRDASASACYAHFQMGLMTTGLIEYYLMSRDREALDAMIGFADCMTHHALLRDESGKPRGWTYAFGDYWGPYNWTDAGGKATWHVSNFVCVEDIGWIAQFTGRDDYYKLIAAALAEPGGGLDLETAAWQANLHPKVDSTPPAAIADLKAVPLGEGTVKLTFTAVGDDGKTGKAAAYQVKYSTAKIVERTAGWPDRTDPQPADEKEWKARAEAFNARQRAFWSGMTAADPPRPQPAGAAESIVVQGLPAGSYNFAIKVWDDADNAGQMSNVVTVDVK